MWTRAPWCWSNPNGLTRFDNNEFSQLENALLRCDNDAITQVRFGVATGAMSIAYIANQRLA